MRFGKLISEMYVMVFIGIKQVKTQKDFKTSLRQAQESFFALVSPLQLATSFFNENLKLD